MYDNVSIMVLAGKGGSGAITFRREKFVPFGGADGGDGGNGGNVIIKADPSVSNFHALFQNGLYRARDGENGQNKKKFGKSGEDLVISVPVGTTVYESTEDGRVEIGDLRMEEGSLVVAHGGKGGRGNVHYATSTNQTPRLAQVGEPGEKKSLELELRLIADAGIIGYPNVGKSSLLAAASAAHPKIANYPFTTKEPELGVVEVGSHDLVLAEIPGLIEGAAQGKGLGHDFLRHSTRTMVLVHLIDGSSAAPVADMIKVNNELFLFDRGLLQKPQIAVVNKIDLPEVRAKREQLVREFREAGVNVYFVSAATGEGVPELMKSIYGLLKTTEPDVIPSPAKVFRPRPLQRGLVVKKEGDVFIVYSHDLERVAARVDLEDPAVRWQLRGLLIRKGAGKVLEKSGIKGGDKVRCGNAEWEW